MVLGILPDEEYLVSQTQIASGGVLLLVTDGVTECLDTGGRLFGVSRLFDTVRKHRSEQATSILEAITSAASEWRGTARQHDDITAMIVRASPNGRSSTDERSMTSLTTH